MSSAFRRITPSAGRLKFSRYAALSAQASKPVASQQQLYFVPRNSNGNLPVYSDIRNGGTRFLVEIRHVQGQSHTLAKDLAKTLFPSNTLESRKLKASVKNETNVIISGGHWKHHVVEWMKSKGF